ncbi:MAG: leucine-rich repeat protein, partial [Candidatus Methanomethylophilaceae archaeon]|nr:leucine-rich repeat protein [Candidatus Methanomethylophilaceae archaeon]
SYLSGIAGDGSLTFSVQNGPFSVKISSALKKLNYSGFYRLNLRADGSSVTELPGPAEVSLPLELDSGMHADVWNISPSGAATHIEPVFDGGRAVFSASLMQFYAVGTTDKASVRQTVVCPYGECEYSLEGSGLKGSSVLESMYLDNMGEILFVPSSFGGCTLSAIGAGAFGGVVNAPAAVIPVTVEAFSWTAWSSQSIRDVYFLGDAPVFEGTAPEGVSVHHTGGPGWETGEADLEISVYSGSYRKDTYSFSYYIVGDSAVVHRFISGPYVQLPESVSAGGASYPLAYIGDSAFMFSKDKEIRERYKLENESRSVPEIVELSGQVRGIHTGAFRDSALSALYSAESVDHVWDCAFSGCAGLSNVSFSNGLVFIGEYAFSSCDGKAFTRFDAPDTLKSIGKGAFYGCSCLSAVSLGKSLESVPDDCFGHCSGLTDLSIPDSVRSIGDRAFYGCSGLQFADLNKTETVGKDAFYSPYGTSVMEFAVFGENLASLGQGAFGNCSRISELEVHCERFPSFEGAFTDVDLDAISVFASDDVLDSWSEYSVRPIYEPEPRKDETLLLSVE